MCKISVYSLSEPQEGPIYGPATQKGPNAVHETPPCTIIVQILQVCSVNRTDRLIIRQSVHKYFFTNLITPSQTHVPSIAATSEYARKVKGSES